MSLLSDGAAFRSTTRSAAGGQTVSYARGSTTLMASLTARVGIVFREVTTTYGATLQRSSDFIVTVADLVRDDTAAAFLPEVGDIITLGSVTYSVAEQDGESHYVESDSHGVSIRIHTIVKN